MSSSAAPTTLGQQGSATPTGAAANVGTPNGSPSEVLAEAARLIEAHTPWFETLGLRCEDAGGRGGDVAVETILAFNVVSGLLDAANETVLSPVFVVLKGLLGAVQGAAAAREEIVELIQYCVGISRCLLEAAKAKDMPTSIAAALGEFKGEMEAVGRFVQSYGTRSSGRCCRRVVLSSRDRDTAAGHKQRLQDLLDAVLAGLAVQVHIGINEVKGMIEARDPPRLGALALIPREAPVLPAAYVQRTAILEGVVADLTNPQRSSSATHCLLGMGGGGKTLMASSVVRDDRVRAIFKDGIFWVPVGRECKDLALLLGHLANELARVPTDKSRRCPDRFNGAEEALRHLSAIRTEDRLMCLVVLDNVWDVEVVNAFVSTGFHVLVTTRQRTVISPVSSGLCTEVGDMSEEDALEVLRKTSEARGPLPAEEARKVARDCGMLPLALGMVGTLAKDQPLDPASWRTAHEKLQGKRTKFREMDNGKLFSAVDMSLCDLPSTQQEQLQLMAVMASGVVATSEMLSSLWDQDISDVPIGAGVLVDRCLLQDMLEGYRLHDLVLEYLQLIASMGDVHLARKASSRQGRYLARLEVFRRYTDYREISTRGLYSLIALWSSVKKLDGAVKVEAFYTESLEGVVDIEIARKIGYLLVLLGSYSGAEAVLRKALKGAAERGRDLVEIGGTLDALGEALELQSKYEEADPFYVKAVEIKEKCLGPNHPRLAASLGRRALLLKAQGKYDEAERLYQRCIEIQLVALGPNHPSLAVTLSNKAGLSQAQGKLEGADALVVKAIEIQEKAFGPDHPSLASSLCIRANILQAQGKYDEADRLYLRCIEMEERNLGPDHPELAVGLNNRALLLKKQGKYDEADRLYLRCIAIRERTLGPNHPELARSLSNRANLLQAQGKYDEADHLYLRCIEIAERVPGPDHLQLAASLSSRADLLTVQGKLEEADPLLVRAIEIQEKYLGPDHPELATSLDTRAGLLKSQGKLDEARSLSERALGIRSKSLGEEGHRNTAVVSKAPKEGKELQGKNEETDSLRLADTLMSSAKVLAFQGKLEDANLFYQNAIVIREKALGPDHPSLVDGLNNRAVVLHAQTKYEEAEVLVVRAIGIQENDPESRGPGLAYCLSTLAQLQYAQGKYREADPLYLRAIDRFEQTLGPDHPVFAETLHNRAEALKAQGRVDGARPLLERALATRKEKLGDAHMSTVETLHALNGLDKSQHAQVEGTE